MTYMNLNTCNFWNTNLFMNWPFFFQDNKKWLCSSYDSIPKSNFISSCHNEGKHIKKKFLIYNVTSLTESCPLGNDLRCPGSPSSEDRKLPKQQFYDSPSKDRLQRNGTNHCSGNSKAGKKNDIRNRSKEKVLKTGQVKSETIQNWDISLWKRTFFSPIQCIIKKGKEIKYIHDLFPYFIRRVRAFILCELSPRVMGGS